MGFRFGGWGFDLVGGVLICGEGFGFGGIGFGFGGWGLDLGGGVGV